MRKVAFFVDFREETRQAEVLIWSIGNAGSSPTETDDGALETGLGAVVSSKGFRSRICGQSAIR